MAGLNLERKLYQSAIISTPDGDEIEVEVVRIAGGRCNLQFHAPLKYKIWRKEIYDGANGRNHIRTNSIETDRQTDEV